MSFNNQESVKELFEFVERFGEGFSSVSQSMNILEYLMSKSSRSKTKNLGGANSTRNCSVGILRLRIKKPPPNYRRLLSSASRTTHSIANWQPHKMPPRLQLLSAPARLLSRPFSTSSALALPPREGSRHAQTSNPSVASRLSNLNSAPARAPSSTRRGEQAVKLLDRYSMRSNKYLKDRRADIEYLTNQKDSKDYLRQMPRRWQAGEVYSPHDLSPIEMQKWSRRSMRNEDVVDALGINPLDMYKVRLGCGWKETMC